MSPEEKALSEPGGQLSAEKEFGMSPANLEQVVRLGQSRMLEDTLVKLNADPSLFTEAIDAAKAQDRDAFIGLLQKAGVSPMQANAMWEVIVPIITFQW